MWRGDHASGLEVVNPDGVEVVLAGVALGPVGPALPGAHRGGVLGGDGDESRVPRLDRSRTDRQSGRPRAHPVPQHPVALVLDDAPGRGDGAGRRDVVDVARHEDGVHPPGRGQREGETERLTGDALAPGTRRHGIPDVPALGEQRRGERVPHRDGADDASVAHDPPVRRRHPPLGQRLVGAFHPAQPVHPLLEHGGVAQQVAVTRPVARAVDGGAGEVLDHLPPRVGQVDGGAHELDHRPTLESGHPRRPPDSGRAVPERMGP